ncbi:hypothetical protein CALVIDRAFT_529225 [Calocera viscosa TUFC12733]|uniref:Uncharacterized protein n=1 Tax=Calocera viscosa (strain TUFC12733) TaxID=1330018 RepID=A0A167JLW3_CALVF|nr:hypothetical protein CALVIDRAFT_529225 [Calocera viscosa TUFC12733]
MRLPTLSRSSTPLPGPPSSSSSSGSSHPSSAPSTTSSATSHSGAHTAPRSGKHPPSPLSQPLPPSSPAPAPDEKVKSKQASYNALRSFFRKPAPLSPLDPTVAAGPGERKGEGFLQPPPPLSAGSSACSSDSSSLKTPTDELPEEGTGAHSGVELAGVDEELLRERQKERERERDRVLEKEKAPTRTPSSKLKTLKRMSSWLSSKSSSSARSQGKRTTSAPGRVPTLAHPSAGEGEGEEEEELPPVPPLPAAVQAQKLHLRALTPPPPLGGKRPMATPPAHSPDLPPLERPPTVLEQQPHPRVPYPHPRHIPVLLSTITRLSLPPHVSPHPLLVHPSGTALFPSSTRAHDPTSPRTHSSPTIRRLFKFAVLSRLAPGSPHPLTHAEARELAHLSYRALPQPPAAARPLSPDSIAPRRIKTTRAPPQVRRFLAREPFEHRCALWVHDPERGWVRETVHAAKRRQPLAQGFSPGIKALGRGLEEEEEDESSSDESSSGDELEQLLAPKPRRESVLAPPAVIRPAPAPRAPSAMSVYSTATSRETKERRRSAPLLQLEHPYPHASHAHSLSPTALSQQHEQEQELRTNSKRSKVFSPLSEYGTPGNPAMPLVPDSARLHLLPPGYRKEQEWLDAEGRKKRTLLDQRAQEEREQDEREREKERYRADVRKARERSERGRRGAREDDSPVAEGEGWDANNRRARPASNVVSSHPARPAPHTSNTLPAPAPASNPSRPGRSRTATAPASVQSGREKEDTPPTSHSGSSQLKSDAQPHAQSRSESRPRTQSQSQSQARAGRASVRPEQQKERVRPDSTVSSRLKADRPMSMLALPSFPSMQGMPLTPSYARMSMYAPSPVPTSPVSPISPVGISMSGLPTIPSVPMNLAASQSLAQLQMQYQYQAQAQFAASQSMAQLHFQQMQMQQQMHAQAQAQAQSVAMAQMGSTRGMAGSGLGTQGRRSRRQTVDFASAML